MPYCDDASSAHLLEGGQAGKNGPSNPDGVFALRGRHDLDLHAAGCARGNLLGHTILYAWEHGGACADGMPSSVPAELACRRQAPG